MPQIVLIATEHINQHGIVARKGDQFETTPLLAAVLTLSRKAVFLTADNKRRQKRTYSRRDMTAETATE